MNVMTLGLLAPVVLLLEAEGSVVLIMFHRASPTISRMLWTNWTRRTFYSWPDKRYATCVVRSGYMCLLNALKFSMGRPIFAKGYGIDFYMYGILIFSTYFRPQFVYLKCVLASTLNLKLHLKH